MLKLHQDTLHYLGAKFRIRSSEMFNNNGASRTNFTSLTETHNTQTRKPPLFSSYYHHLLPWFSINLLHFPSFCQFTNCGGRTGEFLTQLFFAKCFDKATQMVFDSVVIIMTQFTRCKTIVSGSCVAPDNMWASLIQWKSESFLENDRTEMTDSSRSISHL